MIRIPEHLAIGHASVREGKSASQSAYEIGRSFMPSVIEWGGVKPGDRFLDIGCGPGRMAIALAEAMDGEIDYLGFDIRKDDIAFCIEGITPFLPSFRFVQIDVRNDYYNKTGAIDPLHARFPADDASVDFALAASVFTHMFTDETLRYFEECARVIRPGGKLFATFFLLDDDVLARQEQWSRKFKSFTPIDENAFTATPHAPGKVVAYQKAFILDALERAGFEIERHYPGAWSGAPGKHSQDDIVTRRR